MAENKIQELLGEIIGLFKEEAKTKVTLVVRNPGLAGDGDLLSTNDRDVQEIISVVRRFMNQVDPGSEVLGDKSFEDQGGEA